MFRFGTDSPSPTGRSRLISSLFPFFRVFSSSIRCTCTTWFHWPSQWVLRRVALHFGHELLLLHPPVLEPNGDLPLRQVGGGGDLPPLVFGDELVRGVFFLQLFQLDFGVRYSLLPAPPERRTVVLVRHHVCWKADRRWGKQASVGAELRNFWKWKNDWKGEACPSADHYSVVSGASRQITHQQHRLAAIQRPPQLMALITGIYHANTFDKRQETQSILLRFIVSFSCLP